MSIEKVEVQNPYSPWRFEAFASEAGRRFSAVSERVMVDTSERTIQQFAEFEALKTQQVEVSLTEGGWLRLERDARGNITLHYRVADWKVRAALKGEVMVTGEFTGNFCREFGALLRGNTG